MKTVHSSIIRSLMLVGALTCGSQALAQTNPEGSVSVSNASTANNGKPLTAPPNLKEEIAEDHLKGTAQLVTITSMKARHFGQS